MQDTVELNVTADELLILTNAVRAFKRDLEKELEDKGTEIKGLMKNYIVQANKLEYFLEAKSDELKEKK